MKVYLVGGAVRDELLGKPIHERDWVVVGSSPQEMLDHGFKAVGKDFPVFLHPETHEEYALARTEKKVAPGYSGFVFHASPDVSLTDDLKRRDLTINAIAKDESGEFIDPYSGQGDIKKKILRHVSDAFIEDPVRILRIARFHAYMPEFTIAPETMDLMKQMVNSGEVSALVAERVWKEFIRALAAPKPSQFFETLAQCRALEIIFPTLIQPIATLQQVDKSKTDAKTRFTLLLQYISEEQISEFCNALRTAKTYKTATLLLKRLYSNKSQTAEILLTTLEKLDAFRRPERLQQFLKAVIILSPNCDQVRYLTPCLQACIDSDISALIKNQEPKNIPNVIHEHRLQLIKNTLASDKN